MVEEYVNRLSYLCDTMPGILNHLSEEEFSTKASPNKWSKKEILGHLIDSATNNHQRFIRAQIEDVPVIFYDQDKWNRFNFYQQINSKQLIDFWAVYNKHLVEIIKQIPKENWQRTCKLNNGTERTLLFYFEDYVKHLEYHLSQIININEYNS